MLSSLASEYRSLSSVPTKQEHLFENGNLSGSDDEADGVCPPLQEPLCQKKTDSRSKRKDEYLMRLLRKRETSSAQHDSVVRLMSRRLVPDRMSSVPVTAGNPLWCGQFSKRGDTFAVGGKESGPNPNAFCTCVDHETTPVFAVHRLFVQDDTLRFYKPAESGGDWQLSHEVMPWFMAQCKLL